MNFCHDWCLLAISFWLQIQWSPVFDRKCLKCGLNCIGSKYGPVGSLCGYGYIWLSHEVGISLISSANTCFWNRTFLHYDILLRPRKYLWIFNVTLIKYFSINFICAWNIISEIWKLSFSHLEEAFRSCFLFTVLHTSLLKRLLQKSTDFLFKLFSLTLHTLQFSSHSFLSRIT
jgi:hypothetical protein